MSIFLKNIYFGDLLRRLAIFLAACATCAFAAGDSSEPHKLQPVPLKQVTINDPFWTPKRTTWQTVTILDAFTKFENDRGGAINNFDRVRDGEQGHQPKLAR